MQISSVPDNLFSLSYALNKATPKMPSKDSEVAITNGGRSHGWEGGGSGTCNGSVCVSVPECTWSPLHGSEVNTLTLDRYAVVVLNQPIRIPPKLMVNLWNDAKVRMTVDGGTSHWYQFYDDVKTLYPDLKINYAHPNIISGDLDSLPQGMIDLVKKNGCQIIKTPDQNYTDFRKALQILSDRNYEIDTVVAVAENGGRLDHTLANLNTHYVMDSIFTKRHVTLYSISSDSLTWLLRRGKHSIAIPQRLRDSATWCSLLPVGQSTIVTTSGLAYDMCASELAFGVLVSSSNSYNGEEFVRIVTSSNVLWSMGLGFLHD